MIQVWVRRRAAATRVRLAKRAPGPWRERCAPGCPCARPEDLDFSIGWCPPDLQTGGCLVVVFYRPELLLVQREYPCSPGDHSRHRMAFLETGGDRCGVWRECVPPAATHGHREPHETPRRFFVLESDVRQSRPLSNKCVSEGGASMKKFLRPAHRSVSVPLNQMRSARTTRRPSHELCCTVR